MSGFRVFWLKHFELSGGFFGFGSAFSEEDFHAFELFVGELNEPNFAIGWDNFPDSVHVDGGVFLAGAVAVVDGVLHHGETVFEEGLAEVGVLPPRLFGVSGEVEEDDDPHASVA